MTTAATSFRALIPGLSLALSLLMARTAAADNGPMISTPPATAFAACANSSGGAACEYAADLLGLIRVWGICVDSCEFGAESCALRCRAECLETFGDSCLPTAPEYYGCQSAGPIDRLQISLTRGSALLLGLLLVVWARRRDWRKHRRHECEPDAATASRPQADG